MLRFLLTILVIMFFMGCESDSDPTNSDGFGGSTGKGGLIVGGDSGHSAQATPKELEEIKGQLVSNAFVRIAGSNVDQLSLSANNLQSKVLSMCSSADLSSLETVRSLWEETARVFHRFAPLAAIPLATKKNPVPKSFEGELDFIYSMAKANSSVVIDREIGRAIDHPENYRPRRPSPIVLGIDAIEYVLFARPLEVQDGKIAECTYLQYVVEDLFQRSVRLKTRWTAEVYDHLKSVDGQIRQHEYISALVSHSTVFTDKVIKDRKMAAPLGIKVTEGFQCEPGVTCHAFFLEHPHSGLNHMGIEENLWALANLFEGDSVAVGFNDLLVAQGIAESDIPGDDFFAVYELWKQLPKNLGDLALAYGESKDDNNDLYQAYIFLKRINDWMKTDFVVDMNTELPGSVQTDSD